MIPQHLGRLARRCPGLAPPDCPIQLRSPLHNIELLRTEVLLCFPPGKGAAPTAASRTGRRQRRLGGHAAAFRSGTTLPVALTRGHGHGGGGGSDDAARSVVAAAAPPHAPAAAGATSGDGTAAPPPTISASELARLFPNGEYGVEMQVRDYELDQFSVVNNAVYSSFFQHARHEAFAALGHNVDDYARRGSPLALSQLNITFRAPLRSRDVFRVTVAVARVTAARLVMHQRILKRTSSSAAPPPETGTTAAAAGAAGGLAGVAEAMETAGGSEELVAEAEAVVVFLDSQYRPARVPREVARLFQAVADLRQQQQQQ